MRTILLVLLTVLLPGCGRGDLSKCFGEFEGTMVLYDQNSDQYTVVNEVRASTRFSPFSTFKIPNSVIALETGVVSDIDQALTWDTRKYPAEEWWPKTWSGGHNLRSAIEYSVVPAYRNIASQIGKQRMQSYVTAFGYGNTDISSGIDSFWLNGSLKISAREQVEFLRKFYSGRIDVSGHSIESVKSILVQEAKDEYTLSYKTGAGSLDDGGHSALGWLVGYVEKQDNVYYFSMNIEGKTFDDVLVPRIEITRSILRELDIVD